MNDERRIARNRLLRHNSHARPRLQPRMIMNAILRALLLILVLSGAITPGMHAASRDARERGYSATQTINRWESVRRGEKKHIFPFQENANVMFNSALVFELAALKPLAEPLLRQVPYNVPEFIEARRLLALLEWFLPLDASLIPANSIVREFLGGSSLKDFKIWRG